MTGAGDHAAYIHAGGIRPAAGEFKDRGRREGGNRQPHLARIGENGGAGHGQRVFVHAGAAVVGAAFQLPDFDRVSGCVGRGSGPRFAAGEVDATGYDVPPDGQRRGLSGRSQPVEAAPCKPVARTRGFYLMAGSLPPLIDPGFPCPRESTRRGRGGGFAWAGRPDRWGHCCADQGRKGGRDRAGIEGPAPASRSAASIGSGWRGRGCQGHGPWLRRQNLREFQRARGLVGLGLAAFFRRADFTKFGVRISCTTHKQN